MSENLAQPQPTETVVPASRYARRRLMLVVGLVILLLVLGVAGVLGYRSFNRRLDAAGKVDRATTLVEDADKIVVQVDEVVRAKVTPELAERARGTAERVGSADEMLAEATALVDQAVRDLTDDERERAELLRDSAQTRREMLQQAPAILTANVGAASAMPLAEEGWEALLEADKLSDRAVTAYNKLSRAGVTQSRELNKQSAGKLAIARDRFSGAESAFPAAPFEAYLELAESRIEMNRLSQRSDAAWLDGKVSEANSIIDDYNRVDRKAVGQAKALPASPSQAIAAAYEEATKSATEAYYAARDRALQADQKVRDY